MRKTVLSIIFLLLSRFAICDVIFFPYPFTGVCYSLELIYNLEIIKNSHSTTNWWGGCGFVGSLVYPSMRSFGFEGAVEGRYYFKTDRFRHFFVSAYLGGALMTDVKYFSTIGLVPGIKVNYKANLTDRLALEPYISFSVPITHELTNNGDNFAFPALTIGARFGFNRLKDKRPET